VAIARALAVEPELIIADEPVSMLDASLRAGILELMQRLKRESGVSLLYVTHDIASARYIADRMLVLYAGLLVEAGPSEQIVQRPRHPYTRLLLSAVPDPRRRGAREPLLRRAGAPHAATGCPFAVRCSRVIGACTEVPELVVLGTDRQVRCHAPLE